MSVSKKLIKKLEEIALSFIEITADTNKSEETKKTVIKDFFDNSLNLSLEKYSKNHFINSKLQATKAELKYLTVSSEDFYNYLETAVKDFYDTLITVKKTRNKQQREQMIMLFYEIKYLAEQHNEIHNINKISKLLKIKCELFELSNCLKKMQRSVQTERRKIYKNLKEVNKNGECE